MYENRRFEREDTVDTGKNVEQNRTSVFWLVATDNRMLDFRLTKEARTASSTIFNPRVSGPSRNLPQTYRFILHT